jgi:hypothetical protein
MLPYRGAITDDKVVAWWVTGLRSESVCVEEKVYSEHERYPGLLRRPLAMRRAAIVFLHQHVNAASCDQTTTLPLRI